MKIIGNLNFDDMRELLFKIFTCDNGMWCCFKNNPYLLDIHTEMFSDEVIRDLGFVLKLQL